MFNNRIFFDDILPARETGEVVVGGSDAAEMLKAAGQAMRHAYAPYSNFPVGACVRGSSGALYVGCNVENASYPIGTCAEESALAAMVAAGERQATAVLVVARGDALCTPCGACRQRIREFCAANAPIYVCSPDEVRATFTIDQLLPQSFGPDTLEAAGPKK